MSVEKKCIKCGEVKGIDLFYVNRRMKDGHLSTCKECFNHYLREKNLSERGFIKKCYGRHSKYNKDKGYYTMYNELDLSNFLYVAGFSKIYLDWVASDFSNSEKPLVKRLDTKKGFSLENLVLGSNSIFNIVSQYAMNGVYMNTFESQVKAHKETGISNKQISCCLSGRCKSAGGFIWKRGGEIKSGENEE